MIKNIMPFHGTSLGGNLGSLGTAGIDAESEAIIDKAEATGKKEEYDTAAEAILQKARVLFKNEAFSQASAYYEAASSVGDGPYENAEYMVGRSFQEWAIQAEENGDLGTAKQAAAKSLNWFNISKASSESVKNAEAVADNVEQIKFTKEYIAYLGGLKVDTKSGKKVATVTKPKNKPKAKIKTTVSTTGTPTVAAAGVPVAAMVAGLAALWWLSKEK